MANSEIHPSSGEAPRSIGAFRLGDTGVGVLTIALIFLTLVAIYHNSFGTLAADDIFFKHATDGSYFLALASYVNGRFVPGMLFQLMSVADIGISEIWDLLQYLALVGISTLAYVFVANLNIKLSQLETFVFASIIAVLPYNLVLLINKNNSLNATLGFFLVAAAIIFFANNSGVKKVNITTIFLFLTISCYQTTIYYFIVFVLSFYLFNGSKKNEVFTGLAQGFAAIAIAVTTYFVVYKMAAAWASVQLSLEANAEVAQHYGKSRAGLIRLSDLPISLLLYAYTIGRTLFESELVLSQPVKLIGLCSFIAVILAIVWQTSRRRTMSDGEHFRMRKQLLMLLFLILAIGSPIHIMLLFKSLPPRVHAHAGAVWAVLFMTGLVLGEYKWRKTILAGAAIFSLGLAHNTIRTVSEIKTRFDQDTILARAIVGDIKRIPDYQPNEPIAFAGEVQEGPRNDTLLMRYYITIMPSKFDKQWAMLGMLEEATGERFRRPNKVFQAEAKRACLVRPSGTPLYEVRTSAKGLVVCLRSSWQTPSSQS